MNIQKAYCEIFKLAAKYKLDIEYYGDDLVIYKNKKELGRFNLYGAYCFIHGYGWGYANGAEKATEIAVNSFSKFKIKP